MKLCKDCRYCVVPDTIRETVRADYFDDPVHLEMFGLVAECHHPSARREEPPDVVTGLVKSRWENARWHRSPGYRDDDPSCGPHAIFFSPREPRELVGFADDDLPDV